MEFTSEYCVWSAVPGYLTLLYSEALLLVTSVNVKLMHLYLRSHV